MPAGKGPEMVRGELCGRMLLGSAQLGRLAVYCLLIFGMALTSTGCHDGRKAKSRMLQVVARADRGEIGMRAAVKELAQIAREEKAVMSIVEAMRQDTNPAHFYWWDALTELGPDASPATPFLIERLKSDREEDSLNAASVLGKIGPGAREAVPALCKTAVSADRHIDRLLRWYSAESLGDIGVKSPEVISVLRQVAQDEYVTARFAAKAALLKLGQDDGTLSFLVQQLGESKHEYRNAAILALHYLGPMAASAVPDLEALVQRENNPYVRENAERAIASIKGRPLED